MPVNEMERPYKVSEAEYEEYLASGIAFIEKYWTKLRPEHGNPSYWCDTCHSFHPDTSICVDRTWKAWSRGRCHIKVDRV